MADLSFAQRRALAELDQLARATRTAYWMATHASPAHYAAWQRAGCPTLNDRETTALDALNDDALALLGSLPDDLRTWSADQWGAVLTYAALAGWSDPKPSLN